MGVEVGRRFSMKGFRFLPRGKNHGCPSGPGKVRADGVQRSKEAIKAALKSAEPTRKIRKGKPLCAAAMIFSTLSLLKPGWGQLKARPMKPL